MLLSANLILFFFEAPHKWEIFMGEDKDENDLLIRYGFPEDIWCVTEGVFLFFVLVLYFLVVSCVVVLVWCVLLTSNLMRVIRCM